MVHKDLVTTDIVVFTPKGDQRSIQAGATVLDFAYLIHSHIGNTAIAAKVNMKLVPLSQVLHSGDQVEIITASNGRPKLEWLKFLQTRHARNVVMDYFRANRPQFIESGRRIYEERLEALGIEPSKALLRAFLEYIQVSDKDELFFRTGLGIIGPEVFRTVAGTGKYKQVREGMYVLAPCCRPIPGDPVIGFKRDDGSIMVHKKSCPEAERLASRYGNRVVVTEFSEERGGDFGVRVSLRGLDRLGLVNELTGYISFTMGINMTEINITSKDGVMEGYIELQVQDRHNLEVMLDGLQKIDGVQSVVRTDIKQK